MNFVYSTEADALYIELQAARSVARTAEVSPSCLVDLDMADQPVGIELIHPARSYLAIAEVVTRWALNSEQTAQLLAYPYQSLTPSRRSASSTSSGRVEVDSRRAVLLTRA